MTQRNSDIVNVCCFQWLSLWLFVKHLEITSAVYNRKTEGNSIHRVSRVWKLLFNSPKTTISSSTFFSGEHLCHKERDACSYCWCLQRRKALLRFSEQTYSDLRISTLSSLYLTPSRLQVVKYALSSLYLLWPNTFLKPKLSLSPWTPEKYERILQLKWL